MPVFFPRPRFLPVAPMRRSGFTLIELLVAITILAIVAVLGWRGLDGIVRARVALTDEMEQTRGLQLALAQMQRDCAMIVDLDAIPGRVPIMVEGGRIVLVRKVFIENQPSAMQLIAYSLKDGVLSRRESQSTRDLRDLDSLWMSVTSEQGGATGVTLQSNVAAMNVRIWMNDGAGWRVPGIDVVASTVSGDASATTMVVPTGIEVALQLQGRPGVLTKIFLLGAT